MKYLTIGIFAFSSLLLSSFKLNETDPCNKEKIYATKDYLYGNSFFAEYDKVKKFPTYEGGKEMIQKFFDENVELTGDAKNIVARYHITFTVNCNGELGNFELRSNPFPGHEELIEACKKMPKWNPTKVKGEFVDCYVRLGFTNQAGKVKVDYREK